MSFQASTWATKQKVPSASAKFILLLLANYADADGFTFVGQKTLAEDASMSPRTIVRHMATLENAGLIRRSRRFREDGSRSSDGTYLCLASAQDQPSANLTSSQNAHRPSDKNDIDQVPICHPINLSEEQLAKQLDSARERRGAQNQEKGTRLPDDWSVPVDFLEFALTEGWSETAVRAEASKFKDYWLSVPGQRGVKRNWLATWRNWIRNSKNFTKGDGNGRRNAIGNHLEGMLAAAREVG